jgi:site-specific DNA recombinase
MGRTRNHVKNGDQPRTITRVAGYLRVSTDDQQESGLGIEDQRTKAKHYAAMSDWPEPVWYVDDGISGRKAPAERPALARLLQDVHAGLVDAVIVRDLSRLARRTRLTLELVEMLAEHDVALASCKERWDTTTSAGKFVLTMFAALAELEAGQTAERTKGAMAERGRRDGEKGGRLPYGYIRTPAGVQVHHETAALVRRIFALQRRGLSRGQIAAQMNTEGTPSPRGGQWYYTSVDWVLKSRAAYLGGLRGESSTVRWPAILGAGSKA